MRLAFGPTRSPHAESAQPRNGGGSRINLLVSSPRWRTNRWAEHLPALLEPMGIDTHSADSAKAAGEVTKNVRVHVAVVDLGLPTDTDAASGGGSIDEDGGLRLLEILARDSHRPATVAVKRGRTTRDDIREINRALRAGAFAVVDQPTDSRGIELMLEVLRRCLIRHYAGIWTGGGGNGR